MNLADRGMLTKMLLAGFPALLSLFVLSWLLWAALSSVGEHSTSSRESGDLTQELLKREIDHLKWASKVSSYIISGSGPLGVQMDDAKCGFGQWYFGDKRKAAEARIPGIAAPLARLAEPHRLLHQAAKTIAEHKQAGDAAKASQVFDTVVTPRLQEVQALLGEVRTQVDAAANADAKAVQDKIAEVRRTLLLAAGVALVLSLGVGFLIARAVTRPVRTLVDYAACVAKGQIDCTLDLAQKDEIGQLADSLRAMVLSLRDQLDYSQGVLNGITVPCSVFSREDTTVFTNQLMVDLIERGGRPEDYYGQTSGQFVWGDPTRETVSTLALRENRTISGEREVKTHKGSTIHASITSAPFRNSRGEVLGTLSVWVDLTALKEQQKRIEASSAAIMDVARELGRVVDVVGSASQELSAQVEQASQGARVQAGRIGETAAAMEEMNATVVEVSRNASQASTAAGEAKHQAEGGESIVSKVIAEIEAVQTLARGLKEDMTSLGRQAEGIGQIMNVISDIADQTNLLALNAAIEAARAGDAGRGFAVVADEVRKLAEKTMTATKEVGEAIAGIQQGTRKNIENVEGAVRRIGAATGLAGDSGQALHAIVSLVDQTSDQVRSIATAAEQQSSSSEEINRTLADINQVSAETARAMQEAATAVGELAAQAENLQALMGRMQQA
jgi:methyl-accepting chemotaxis protein